jgi:long-chain-acyl-CoA dehydrogenase
MTGFYGDDHEAYRDTVRSFVRREVEPEYLRWEQERLVPRETWTAAGAQGILGLAVPAAFGGAGVEDYRYRMIVSEELAAVGATSLAVGFSVHDDVVTPYLTALGTPYQHGRWLPGIAAGTRIGAIAMTEPGAGSDLQAIRTRARRVEGGWRLDGQKTFITNGIHADLVIVVARTDPDAGSRGLSLLVVEAGQDGFERGRKLDKVGLVAQDTAELSFDGVLVPDEQVLGRPGAGFGYLMEGLPRERVALAAGAVAAARAALTWTSAYVFERSVFGSRLGDLQHTRFALAEMETEVDVADSYLRECVSALDAGTLTPVRAAKLKWFTTELQVRITGRCVQLFGGYGYMNEYPIARAFRDSRVQTVYGGTTEVMKEIIGRDIAARYPQPGPTTGPDGSD